jgi:hypothetical protein
LKHADRPLGFPVGLGDFDVEPIELSPVAPAWAHQAHAEGVRQGLLDGCLVFLGVALAACLCLALLYALAPGMRRDPYQTIDPASSAWSRSQEANH